MATRVSSTRFVGAAEAVGRARELIEVARTAATGLGSGEQPLARAHLTDSEAQLLRAEGRAEAAAFATAADGGEATSKAPARRPPGAPPTSSA